MWFNCRPGYAALTLEVLPSERLLRGRAELAIPREGITRSVELVLANPY
jgi:hypothetical protein